MLAITKINIIVILFHSNKPKKSRDFQRSYNPKFMCYLKQYVIWQAPKLAHKLYGTLNYSIVWYHIGDILQKIIIMYKIFLNKMWPAILLYSSLPHSFYCRTFPVHTVNLTSSESDNSSSSYLMIVFGTRAPAGHL